MWDLLGKDDTEERSEKVLEKEQVERQSNKLQWWERKCDAIGTHKGMQASETRSRCAERWVLIALCKILNMKSISGIFD